MGKARPPIPELGQPLIETHCHLDHLEQAPLADILARTVALGVERLVTIAIEPDNLDTVRGLAATHDPVYATQGVHPHEAGKFDDAAAGRIESGLADDKVVAVGEIGLDYYYDHAPRGLQREVFARQLRIAADADRPIVVHTREAEDDTRAILEEFAPQLGRKGVIHSFTSSLALAEDCLALGFSLGFNGIITFNKADNVREVLAATPPERLLLETDSPYLTPVPYRGRENAPFYLPFVAVKAAEVLGLPLGELLGQVHRNSLALFWPAHAAPPVAGPG